MQKFKTLLLREWMQHQRGWYVLMALPFVVILGFGLFGQLHFDIDEAGGPELPLPIAAAMAAIVGIGGLTLMLAWAASLIQAPGLARRDVQDRSIEFWLSLPVSNSQAIAATLLMHLVLWPWLALLVGVGGGLLASVPIVGKLFGIGAWFSLPWGGLVPALAMLVLRLMLGTLLATLWLAPVILGTMAASAWLKRWGLPVVAGVVGGGGLLLDKLYGNPIVWETLLGLGARASQALMVADRTGNGPKGMVIHDDGDIAGALGMMPGWLLHDAGSALAQLASPAFLAATAVGLLAFGALWLRRQRGA